MDGHATSVEWLYRGQRQFRWEAHAEKFRDFANPDPSYHGLTYTKAFGEISVHHESISQLMRDLGAIQSPQNAFPMNLGLETAHLRVPQHCKNALAVAQWLQKCDKVAWVHCSRNC